MGGTSGDTRSFPSPSRASTCATSMLPGTTGASMSRGKPRFAAGGRRDPVDRSTFRSCLASAWRRTWRRPSRPASWTVRTSCDAAVRGRASGARTWTPRPTLGGSSTSRASTRLGWSTSPFTWAASCAWSRRWRAGGARTRVTGALQMRRSCPSCRMSWKLRWRPTPRAPCERTIGCYVGGTTRVARSAARSRERPPQRSRWSWLIPRSSFEQRPEAPLPCVSTVAWWRGGVVVWGRGLGGSEKALPQVVAFSRPAVDFVALDGMVCALLDCDVPVCSGQFEAARLRLLTSTLDDRDVLTLSEHGRDRRAGCAARRWPPSSVEQ